MYIIYIKVGHFEFDLVDIFRAYPSLKPHILLYSNGIVIWHSIPDIMHIIINNDHKSATLDLIDLKFFRV